MGKSFNKIYIHAVWCTKDRYPFLQYDIEYDVYSFINEQFEKLGCGLKIINEMPDHIHCLFAMDQSLSVAQVIKQVKGSSSFWINKNELTEDNFSWQSGYASFSVSESLLDKIYLYIKNQKKHHQGNKLMGEYEL